MRSGEPGVAAGGERVSILATIGIAAPWEPETEVASTAVSGRGRLGNLRGAGRRKGDVGICSSSPLSSCLTCGED
jgi:hypothetical protein